MVRVSGRRPLGGMRRRGRVKLAVSIALAVPGALMLADWWQGRALAMDLLHPTGELSVRLMILAMLAGPLVELFGTAHPLGRMLRGWLTIRRNLGVAAFGYAVLHLVFYAADMTVAGMVDELPIPSIWTGWLALALLAIPAAISFDAAVKALRRRWKQVQYLVYPAFIIALAHWLLLDWHWLGAALHLGPLALAWTLRLARRRSLSRTRGFPA